MAVTVGNIIVGPGDLWTGVGTFVDGTLIVIDRATGGPDISAPHTGTHIGASEGDTRIQLGFDLYDAAINEYHTAPLSVLQNQWMEIGGTIDEVTDPNLDMMTNEFGTVSSNVLYWGSVSLPAPATTDTGVLYTVPLRTQYHFFAAAMYNAYFVNVLEMTVASMQGMAMQSIPYTMRAHPTTTFTTTANLGYINPDQTGVV